MSTRHALDFFRRLFVLLSAGSLCALPLGFVGASGPETGTPTRANGASLGRSERDPAFAFERNDGQMDARSRFVARNANAALFLTASGSVLTLGSGPDRTILRTDFAGGRDNAPLVGEGLLPGRAHYFQGTDKSTWVTEVERFAAVRAEGVYPGIDVLYYSVTGGIEYDLIVSPGADPARVEVRIDGARRMRISPEGDLVLNTPTGDVVHRRPMTYQVVDGRRIVVPSAYVLRGDRGFGFSIGEYDRTHELVIDPKLVYSSYLGGSNNDRALGVGLDAGGNTFVAGRTFSPDFPVLGGVQATRAGDYDAFVTKFDPTGATILYSTFLGGNGFDEALAMDVTAAGEVVIGGDTSSSNFPVSSPFQALPGGGIDGFVARLSASGSVLVTSSYCGGFTTETIEAIGVDALGNVSFGGSTASDTTYPLVLPLQGAYGGGSTDGIFGRVSPAGVLLNSSFIGGAGSDLVDDIAVDAAGNVFMTGRTQNIGFPVVGGFQTAGGGTDAFVTMIAAGFASIVYSSPLGGTLEDAGTGIAVDAAGNAYITGYTKSTNFPSINAFQPALDNGFDAFVTKVNAAGTSRVYSSYLGGDLEDRGRAIAVDSTGSAVIVGQTRSTDFRVVSPSQPNNGGNGLNDGFVARIGATGRQLIYSTYLGGDRIDIAQAVAIDAARTAYVAGYSTSLNFPVVGAAQPGNAGVDDVFITRIAEPGDTPGIVFQGAAPPAWFLRNSQSPGPADITLSYGPSDASWIPLAGDWDGNGTDTPGLYNPATGAFFLRNSSTNGPANIVFSFGSPSIYLPIAGDWNGDGIDTIGIFNPSTGVYFLKNTNAAGPSDHGFTFGAGGGGIFPVAGDWDGNGSDSVGFYDVLTGTWFLRNNLTNGPADFTFTFGPGGYTALAGDWNADGIDTPGIYDPGSGSWFLSNTNASGPADVVFGFGAGAGSPLAGDWNG